MPRTPTSSASAYTCFSHQCTKSFSHPFLWGSSISVRSAARRPIVANLKSQLASSFYDDFEDFGEIGSGSDKSSDSGKDSGENSNSDSNDKEKKVSDNDEVDVMSSLRARLNELSNQKDEEDEEDEDDDEEEDDDEYDDDDDEMESGSALPDMEGRDSLSSIDDLIGFAQSKAKEERNDGKKDWAVPIPFVDESTGEKLDFKKLLEGGVVLVANPAKFCDDLEDVGNKDKDSDKGGFNIASLLDPFPISSSSGDTGGVSQELLAKFGLTIPPPPDLGADRRADLMPVLLLTGSDAKGYRAVIMNRRTGYLIGDMERQAMAQMENDEDVENDEDFDPEPPKPRLGAFMIQPLWYGGAGDETDENEGGGGLDMLHFCSLVEGATKLPKSDGLYWGGDAVQAQEVMQDKRLDEYLSGFDFKFFISYTRWSASEVSNVSFM